MNKERKRKKERRKGRKKERKNERKKERQKKERKSEKRKKGPYHEEATYFRCNLLSAHGVFSRNLPSHLTKHVHFPKDKISRF